MATVLELERSTTPTVALLAHDAMKPHLLRLVRAHDDTLARCRLIATRSTGQTILNACPLPIELLEGGPLGGDLQIAGMVVDRLVDAVVFLRDPQTAHPFEPDPHTLLRVCDVHDVPIATNAAAAEVLLGWVAARATHPSVRMS